MSGDEICVIEGHTGVATSMAFSPDGKSIAIGNHNGTIKIWDAETGQESCKFDQLHVKRVTIVEFSPDSKRIVSFSDDGSFRVWDAKSGEQVFKHLKEATDVGFSPDANLIVTSSLDRTVRIWDAASGKICLTLRGHTGPVQGVAFSPDGRRIVSGGQNEILIWDAKTGQELLKLTQFPSIISFGIQRITFTPDGTRIVSVDSMGTITVWDASLSAEDKKLAE